MEAANIQITVDPPSGLILTGDATLLVTALSNLIDNAVSYSPAGSPVSISTRLVSGFVEIAVTDQGRGIAPEYQERVFERFFRVDRALSRSTGAPVWGWRSSSESRSTMAVTSSFGVDPAPGRRSPCGSPRITSDCSARRARRQHPST